VIIAFSITRKKYRGRALLPNAVALISGGGISNLVDRAFAGGIRDIFHSQLNSFNVADCAIVLGALGLFLLIIYSHHKNPLLALLI
jgi:lipoprotein signal peptidase